MAGPSASGAAWSSPRGGMPSRRQTGAEWARGASRGKDPGMLKRASIIAWLAVLFPVFPQGVSLSAEYPREGDVIGHRRTWPVSGDESLPEIARRFDVGYDAIVAANPGVDPFVPGPGRKVAVPTQWILPEASARDGIVINVAEMRLYLFGRRGSRTVTTFPVGIGDEGTDTPVGTFSIIEKIVDPAWHVPRSIRKKTPDLPPSCPPARTIRWGAARCAFPTRRS